MGYGKVRCIVAQILTLTRITYIYTRTKVEAIDVNQDLQCNKQIILIVSHYLNHEENPFKHGALRT